MGLDIYLYHYEGHPSFNTMDEARKSFDEVSEKASEASNAAWPSDREYNSLTEKEIETFRKAGKKAADKVTKGTPWAKTKDKYGDVSFCEKCIEINSTKYPDHMFKIGYFRSSYNSGGINQVLENNNINTLYDIFPHDDKDYHVIPDWKESLQIVNDTIEAFKPIAAEGLSVTFVNSNEPAANEKDALAIYRAEMEINKNRSDGGPFGGNSGYSSSKGTFYINGEAIQARGFIGGEKYGQKGAYVIYQVSPKGDNEGLGWYLKALEIVKETIEWVLAQPDPENYYFHWSG